MTMIPLSIETQISFNLHYVLSLRRRADANSADFAFPVIPSVDPDEAAITSIDR